MKYLWLAAVLVCMSMTAHAQTYFGVLSGSGLGGSCCTSVAVKDGTGLAVPTDGSCNGCSVITQSQYNAFITASNNLYEHKYPLVIAQGIALTSTGNSALNSTYSIDDATVNYLSGIFNLIKDAVIATSSISGTVLTVTAVQPDTGQIITKMTVTGSGIAANTSIASPGTGTGDTGTYNLTGSSQTVGSEYMIIGGKGTGFSSIDPANPGTASFMAIPDINNTLHTFNPVQFLNYVRAVANYRALLKPNAVAANGWPANNQVTIP